MKAIAFVILSILAVSCGKPTGSIDGQVFVVRADRETIKLSLVSVYLISELEATNRIFTVGEQLKALPRLESRLTEVKSEIVQLEGDITHLENLQDLIDYQVRLARDAMRSIPPDYAKNRRHAMEAQANRERAKTAPEELRVKREKLGLATNSRNEIEVRIKELGSPEIYIQAPWTSVVAHTTTDADGKFKFNRDAGGYYIAAHTSRRVLDGDEHYTWIIRAETNTMLVSNHNAISAVKTKTEPTQ